MVDTPYADAARAYFAAGWKAPIPVGYGPGKKNPPIAGYTGWTGVDPSYADIEAWCQPPRGRKAEDRTAEWNIALHLTGDQLSVDVDARHGGDITLARLEREMEEQYGEPVPFPRNTWSSTSRGPADPGRQYLFKAELPAGRRWVSHPGGENSGIDNIHTGHRFTVSWPSINPETGTVYEWYDADGELYEGVPSPDELTTLDPRWVLKLSQEGDVITGAAASYEEALQVVGTFRPAPACKCVTAALNKERQRLMEATQGKGGIHSTGGQMALVGLGFKGHAGVQAALSEHQAAWRLARSGRDGTTEAEADREWLRMLLGAVGKLLAQHDGEILAECRCGVKKERAPRVTPVLSSIPTPLGERVETFGPVKLAELAEPRLLGRFRWCGELGWLAHDGTRWVVNNEPAALRALCDVIREYTASIVKERMLDPDDIRELAGLSAGSTQAHALKLLRAAPGIYTPALAFDALPPNGMPWTLPCSNGITIEMHADGSITTRATTPGDLNTRTACAYDPQAKAPGIAAAFRQYQPDENVRRYKMQMWARGLSGMGAENFIADIGEGGGNGKGTMAGLIQAVAGDYAAELPIEVILKGRGSAREVYRSELAALRGCRLLFCEEPDEGVSYDLGMLKKITGGGEMEGRAMGKERVKFPAKWLFEMAANKRPGWPADGAMTRRYIEIAWNFSIMQVVGGVREDFKEALKAEASGFLNGILAQWTGTTKPVMPDIIVRQTLHGAAEASPLAQFAKDALIPSDEGRSRASDLYAGYQRWAIKSGIKMPMTITKFGMEMPRLGYEKRPLKDGTYYMNVTLNTDFTSQMGTTWNR